MTAIIATVGSKGRVTIPAEVRRHLGVSAGDKLTFIIGDDGSVHIEPLSYPTIASLAGKAGKLEHPLPWKEMLRIAYEDRHIEERKLR